MEPEINDLAELILAFGNLGNFNRCQMTRPGLRLPAVQGLALHSSVVQKIAQACTYGVHGFFAEPGQDHAAYVHA